MLSALGAAFFALLAGVRAGQLISGSYAGALPAAQSLLAAWQMLRRSSPQRRSRPLLHAFAWATAVLPLALRSGADAPLVLAFLGGTGVLFSLWGLCALGRSFGIAPCDRGLVARGPYRFVRHPMYAGELLSFATVLAGRLDGWNGMVFILIVAALLIRIHFEEQQLEGYAEYAAAVRYRLLPGIW